MSLRASNATIDRFIDLLVDAVAREAVELPTNEKPAASDKTKPRAGDRRDEHSPDYAANASTAALPRV